MMTKTVRLNRLLKTPLSMSALATLVSLLFASLINQLFLTPESLKMTLLITFIISAPMSYITIKFVMTMRLTIENQKMKLLLEHERAEILAQFIRDAAHEFKTPLTLMSTNLYLMERTVDPQKKQNYTENTNEQVNTLNALVETILILTRLDSTDKEVYPRQPIRPSEILSDIRSFNSNGRVKIVVEEAAALPIVRVNLEDLHLALKQMIDNALRFSPASSDVTVTVATSDSSLTIQIGDKGHGMTAETIPHIFDRFYRIDASHTTRGLGLGLAIAKRVIELHDGRIEVLSETGKGTTFNIYLPIH